MKKLFLFTLLISSFLVISCKNNTTDSTSGGNSTISKYKANGITSVYEGKGYKFFSIDGKTYDISIQNGGISVTGVEGFNFDKSSIYSINADGDIYENYKVYVIYNNDYHGLIMFPKDDTISGNILLKKLSDNTKTEGLIDIDRANRNIPNDYKGTWKRTSSGTTQTVTIDDTFVSIPYQTSSKQIPSSFFVNNNGIPTVLATFYGGTKMTINNDSSLTITFYYSLPSWYLIIKDGKIIDYYFNVSAGNITIGKLIKQQ